MSTLLSDNLGSGFANTRVSGPDPSSGANYATLGTYNTNNGFRGIRPPVPMTSVSGYYVVPAYSAPGYNTLTHGRGTGGNYFQIQQAYGSGAQNCNTKYMGALCQ